MRNIFTFFLVVFIFSGLSAQTECTVKILFSMNKSLPPSYTFKTDPAPEGAKYYWSFGDNTNSDSPSPTHTFRLANTYLVQVKVVTPDGKSCYGEVKSRFEGANIIVAPVILSGKGKVKMPGTNDGCRLLIYLENGTVLAPVEIVPAFEFKDGQYIELAYELVKEKPSGCASGISAKIYKIAEIVVPTVCKLPVNFKKNDAKPVSYTFSTETQPADSKYYWYFGDGGISELATPTYAFKKAGIWVVNLKVVDKNGKVCYGEVKAQFEGETDPSCKFDIVVRPKEGNPGTFQFFAVSPAEIKIWKWNFGDGKYSDQKNPEHTFEKPSIYEVSCTITTAAGCTETRIIKHTVLPVPLATCKGAMNLLLFDPTEKCNGKATIKLLDEMGVEMKEAKYLWSDGRTGSTVDNLCPDKPYSVQAIIEGVCQKNASFTLLSKPLWRVTTTNGKNKFSVISPKDEIEYEWDFGDGKVVKGAEIDYNFENDGLYNVTLKAVSGSNFTEYTQQVEVLKSITGIRNIKKQQLEVYPNPVKDLLMLNFGNAVTGTIVIEIMNIAGQVTYSQELTAEGLNQTVINVKNLKPGIYFLKVINGNNPFADRKFIKAD